MTALALGLMSGVFWIYQNAFMPGLGRTDDRTFITAFQAVDRRIINPVFLLTYFSGLVLCILSAILTWGTPAAPFTSASVFLYLATFLITGVVNVPANDRIKAAAEPDRIDLPAVREDFDEATWVRWNRVRTVTTVAAFAVVLVAIALSPWPV